MLLAIDIGNTNIVAGLFEGERLVVDFRLRTEHDLTADEIALSLKGLMSLRDLDLACVTAMVIACVVPPLVWPFREFGRRYLGCPVLVVGEDGQPGIAVLYDSPSEIGADRLINALAAWRQYRCALIVVDYGTATTFDCVSEAGEYLGGAISPGLAPAAEALFVKAARLPKVELFSYPHRAIGKNTMESMRAGLILGFAALTDGLIERLEAEMGQRAKIIATGGLAPIMAQYSRRIEIVRPHLTLEGLRLFYEYNRSS
ncbi:type III pantothenate kinase [Thermosulfuriphilus sp.]